MDFKHEPDNTTAQLEKKYNIFDPKERRSRLKRKINSKRGYLNHKEYPPEIFTHPWNKFKSLYGHSKKEEDPDNPISKKFSNIRNFTGTDGSSIYNLVYDKMGRHVISGADDGLIKIWSTANGELVNTLIGHTSDINALSISDCGTYLASCCCDGIIRIWKVTNELPVAVFKDQSGVICSLEFFCVPFNVQGETKVKKGLASASSEGTIKLYFEEDFVNNGGILKKDQAHITLNLENDNLSDGVSSIKFHPDGFIAAGTRSGSIVIWNKLSEINHLYIDDHQIIKFAHSKDCHLTLWNKEGNMLFSASFDGTAKIWPWDSKDFFANQETASLFTFEEKYDKILYIDVKCCSIAWSSRGRYAIASFCTRLEGMINVQSLYSSIQIYDVKLNQKTHKFDKTYDGEVLGNYIFILEPHPFNEAILMSADYGGKIILWNIEIGVMLNCFVENCGQLGYPLIEAPILDGRFSPDGLSLCVATYYGFITLYGYGEKDLFLTTPFEQFYSKEFLKFEIDPNTHRVLAGASELHMLEKGALCTAKKKVHNPAGNTEAFQEQEYYERYLEVTIYKNKRDNMKGFKKH